MECVDCGSTVFVRDNTICDVVCTTCGLVACTDNIQWVHVSTNASVTEDTHKILEHIVNVLDLPRQVVYDSTEHLSEDETSRYTCLALVINVCHFVHNRAVDPGQAAKMVNLDNMKLLTKKIQDVRDRCFNNVPSRVQIEQHVRAILVKVGSRVTHLGRRIGGLEELNQSYLSIACGVVHVDYDVPLDKVCKAAEINKQTVKRAVAAIRKLKA